MSNDFPNQNLSPIGKFVTGNTVRTGTWRKVQVYNPATNIYSAYDQNGHPVNRQYLNSDRNGEMAARNDFENPQLQQHLDQNPYVVKMRKAFSDAYQQRMENCSRDQSNNVREAPWLIHRSETLMNNLNGPCFHSYSTTNAAHQNLSNTAHPKVTMEQANIALAGNCLSSLQCVPLFRRPAHRNQLLNSFRLRQPRSYQELVHMQQIMIKLARAGFFPDNFPFPPPHLPSNFVKPADDSSSLSPYHLSHTRAIGDDRAESDAQINAAGSQHFALPTSEHSDAMNSDSSKVPLDPAGLPLDPRPQDIFDGMDMWTDGANIPKEVKITKLFGNIDCKLETKAWVIDTHRDAHTYFKKNKRCMVSYISALKLCVEEDHVVETFSSTEPGNSWSKKD